jgi:hypothetical protein
MTTKKPFEVVLCATQTAIRPNEIHFGRCYDANNNQNENINDNYSHADAVDVSVRSVDGQREASEYSHTSLDAGAASRIVELPQSAKWAA